MNNSLELILVDWGRGYKNQTGLVGDDSLVSQDVSQVLRVLWQRDVLVAGASLKAGVICAKEDSLV